MPTRASAFGPVTPPSSFQPGRPLNTPTPRTGLARLGTGGGEFRVELVRAAWPLILYPQMEPALVLAARLGHRCARIAATHTGRRGGEVDWPAVNEDDRWLLAFEPPSELEVFGLGSIANIRLEPGYRSALGVAGLAHFRPLLIDAWSRFRNVRIR